MVIGQREMTIACSAQMFVFEAIYSNRVAVCVDLAVNNATSCTYNYMHGHVSPRL